MTWTHHTHGSIAMKSEIHDDFIQGWEMECLVSACGTGNNVSNQASNGGKGGKE